MSQSKVVIVLGAPTPPGRFNTALNWLMEAGREEFPDVDFELISLRELGPYLVDGSALESYGEDIASAVAKVVAASGVILASPIFRASYTGLLKDFLDLLPVDALFGKPTAIVGMGASKEHYLALDSQMRPVLAWFGALTLPVSAYIRSDHFESGLLKEDGQAELLPLLRYVVELADSIPTDCLLPLAARQMRPPVPVTPVAP